MADTKNVSRRKKLKVDMYVEGVSNVGNITHPLWIRYKVGRHSGETGPAMCNKRGNVEWNELITFKTTFKLNAKGDGYESKNIVVALRGKRGRTHYSLGTLTFDLSLYVRDVSTALHLNFESGTKSLADNTEFRGKVRVSPLGGGMDVMDVSSTMNEEDDSIDEEFEAGRLAAADSFFSRTLSGQRNKFILSPEELTKKTDTKGMAPGIRIQGYEKELQDLKKRFILERRDLEERHSLEVKRLEQQIRGMTAEYESKVAEMDEEIRRLHAASTSGALATLRKELEELEEEVSEKSSIIETVRTQLVEAQAELTDQTAKRAKAEASLQRVERELAVFTSMETQKKEEEMRKKKIRDEVMEMSIKAKAADDERKKSFRNLGSTSPSGSPLLKRRAPIDLELQNGSNWIRMFSMLMLLVAIAFYIFKKLYFKK